jgi:hypothetical protein
VGCEIAPAASWPDAPKDAIIFGQGIAGGRHAPTAPPHHVWPRVQGAAFRARPA